MEENPATPAPATPAAAAKPKRPRRRHLTPEKLHHELLDELAELKADAIAQAKQGKPALLRMLLRTFAELANNTEKEEEAPAPFVDLDIRRPKSD